MSLESIILDNTKAVTALTAALEKLVPALGAATTETKTKGKGKTAETPATTPATTETATTGAAASTPTAGGTATTAAVPAQLDPNDPFSKAVQAFAKAHGRDAAVAIIDKFGGQGRASNIKEIDRPAAFKHVQEEHARLDAVKAAAAAAAKPAADENSLI